MRKLFTASCAFLLFSMLMGSGAAESFAQEEMRRWTSRDNSETVQGSFQSYDPETRQVSIELLAGTSLEVAINKLSQFDRKYVLQLVKNDLGEPNSKGKANAEVVEPRNSKGNLEAIKAFGIQWTPGIDAALSMASGNGKAGNDARPVMWMRVLGDLGGFM